MECNGEACEGKYHAGCAGYGASQETAPDSSEGCRPCRSHQGISVQDLMVLGPLMLIVLVNSRSSQDKTCTRDHKRVSCLPFGCFGSLDLGQAPRHH